MLDRRSQTGFTLVELVISMVLLALISLSIFGLATIGARAAGSGERRTEQARRMRIATRLIVRQLRAAAPLFALMDAEGDGSPQEYFVGEFDRLDFITGQPQLADRGGYALVGYWLEDDVLMMSELPYFMLFSEDRLGSNYDYMMTSTPLLYDVGRFEVAYARSDPETDADWADEWDASFEGNLPAVVRIRIEPASEGGPTWSHEIPVWIGAMNEMWGADDFGRPNEGLDAPDPAPDEPDDTDDRDDRDDPDDGDDSERS